jgi:holliday junction DNA helicase RuvA
MIAHLEGIVFEKALPFIVLKVGGVGYELETSLTTFYQLPEIGQIAHLHVQQVVREDANLLYGFFEQSEKVLFRLLMKVSGVGAKLALAILSSIEAPAFVHCIEHQDAKTLVKIPGIGEKTAQRLVIEMRDRMKVYHQMVSKFPSSRHASATTNQPLSFIDSPQQEALTALMGLGYKPQEASRAIKQFAVEAHLSVEEIIRMVLKNMVKA